MSTGIPKTDSGASGTFLSYVLITPARNEAEFIEETIKSVVKQTIRPKRWVIVSDGSTDGTDDIVGNYIREHTWIELVRMPQRKARHFAGKVYAFNAGYESLRNFSYDIIGNLDADITFEEDYFSFLLRQFSENLRLGVGGTPFKEGAQQYDYRFSSIEHVSGACQLFRRECFEAIGGYSPLERGGIDLAAVITARMKGWQTRTFTERVCHHHKKSQSARHASLSAVFKSGYHDYLMGSHPIWQFFRSGYQMSKEPYVVGGGLLLMGFYWAILTRAQRSVSKDFAKFRGREQMRRLRELLKGIFLFGRTSVC